MNYKILICILLLSVTVTANTSSVLSLINVYPLPSTKSTTIEYFQQLGTTNDIILKIYDIECNEVTEQVSYSFETVINMKKKVIIDPQKLSKGIYIVLLKYKEHSLTVKIFIS